MKKHILSRYAEKKNINIATTYLAGGSYHTDSLEPADVDFFSCNKFRNAETALTEKIEPADLDVLTAGVIAGNDWTKATENIENSDMDNFNGRDSDFTKVSAYLESSDVDLFC